MMPFKSSRSFLLSALLVGAAFAGSCAMPGYYRDQTAMRIASAAWMVKREIPVGSYNLVAFERMHERGQDVTIYIEGDGYADTLQDTVLFDATPTNPVALHLATKDHATNLAYLARPCQYTEDFTPRPEQPLNSCGEEFWTAAKYRSDVLDGYNAAIDDMKQRYGVQGIHLVGYGSGATIVETLAVQRKDIKTVRTVAGLFDMNILGPELDALRYVPQHHFAGANDQKAPPAELHKYLQAIGESECIDYTLIQEAEHDKGWVDKWPKLLKEHVPVCEKPAMPEFIPIEKPETFFTPRNTDVKGK